MHWSKTCHDYFAVVITGGALGLSFSSVEQWLKLIALSLSIVFVVQGIVMRHLKMRYYAAAKKEEDVSE